MNVCVLGLWHLGTVTAACLASGGHHVTGLDFDETVIANLKNGQPPLFEPGLEELVKKGLKPALCVFQRTRKMPCKVLMLFGSPLTPR